MSHYQKEREGKFKLLIEKFRITNNEFIIIILENILLDLSGKEQKKKVFV